MHLKSRVLILDEPTRARPKETSRLGEWKVSLILMDNREWRDLFDELNW